VSGAKKHVRKADKYCWAVRDTGSKRIGIGGEELI
jgi:hypothetical protein